MKKKIVIVGGSAAGPKVASKARRLDQNAEITIIQKGQYLSMASCGYPYYVGGVFDERNQLISTPTGVTRDPDFFTKVKDIKALVSTEVTKINRDKKTVIAKSVDTGEEREIPYDTLILTTGASPIIPNLPGKDLDGIP
jgi:NADPH-dependent 2,4-dienoyl-CoA reductase/sulfur reductase-like enzyme